MKPALALTFLALLFAIPAAAQQDSDLTVQRLRDHCARPPEATVARTICVFYIAGVADTMMIASDDLRRQVQAPAKAALWKMSVCDWGTYGAMIQAFKNWSDKNPDKWHFSANVGVLLALRETWPCN